MADLRFDVDKAVERLQRAAKDERERLASYAAELEHELRTVAASCGAIIDYGGAAAFHVFEVNVRSRLPDGARLELTMAGDRLGESIAARPIEPGRYQAVVQLTLVGRPGDTIR